jgi:two-component system, OmpR family, phosphate regulon sensor histidine kinase PhoR
MLRGLVHAIRRRVAIKLTLTLVGFVALTWLAAGFFVARALEALALEQAEARLVTAGRVIQDEARALLQRGAGPGEVHAFLAPAARAVGARVALITLDGRALGDSDRAPGDAAAVESLAGRPEVRAALGGRRGRDVRPAVETGVPLLHAAMPLLDGGRTVGALRLSVPAEAATPPYGGVIRLVLVGGAVALVVAFAIGLFVAGRVTRPVAEMQAIARRLSDGDFAARAPVRSPDEIGVLGRSLNALAARLREQIDELGREESKAAAILDGMVEGVIAVDEHERVLLMNGQARAIFGLGVEEVTGRPFLEVIRNVDLRELFRDSRRAPTGRVMRRDLLLSTPVERALEASAVPLRVTGRPGVLMVLHDITTLRRLERVRTEFVANLSHELRTPLTAIHGALETLLGGALERAEESRRFLEIAARHTGRLGRLVDDLTDLSNIELGKVELRLAPTSLDEVVDSVLAIIQPRAEAGGVRVETALDPAALEVRADHDRLAQVLINLVDNAVKHTPAGGQVTIGARPAEPGTVEVSVADTGAGIPPGALPRITERFYRVDRARSRELGGTGLGLAIVKHLVMAHGGTLRIESQVGRGTTVRFGLPRVEA